MMGTETLEVMCPEEVVSNKSDVPEKGREGTELVWVML